MTTKKSLAETEQHLLKGFQFFKKVLPTSTSREIHDNMDAGIECLNEASASFNHQNEEELRSGLRKATNTAKGLLNGVRERLLTKAEFLPKFEAVSSDLRLIGKNLHERNVELKATAESVAPVPTSSVAFKSNSLADLGQLRAKFQVVDATANVAEADDDDDDSLTGQKELDTLQKLTTAALNKATNLLRTKDGYFALVQNAAVVPTLNSMDTYKDEDVAALHALQVKISPKEIAYLVIRKQNLLMIDENKLDAEHAAAAKVQRKEQLSGVRKTRKVRDSVTQQLEAQVKEAEEELATVNAVKFPKKTARLEAALNEASKKLEKRIATIEMSEADKHSLDQEVRRVKREDERDSGSTDKFMYVQNILDQLNERAHTHLTLVSPLPRSNGLSAGLKCFWIADKHYLERLTRKFRLSTSKGMVNEWGFIRS